MRFRRSCDSLPNSLVSIALPTPVLRCSMNCKVQDVQPVLVQFINHEPDNLLVFLSNHADAVTLSQTPDESSYSKRIQTGILNSQHSWHVTTDHPTDMNTDRSLIGFVGLLSSETPLQQVISLACRARVQISPRAIEISKGRCCTKAKNLLPGLHLDLRLDPPSKADLASGDAFPKHVQIGQISHKDFRSRFCVMPCVPAAGSDSLPSLQFQRVCGVRLR